MGYNFHIGPIKNKSDKIEFALKNFNSNYLKEIYFSHPKPFLARPIFFSNFTPGPDLVFRTALIGISRFIRN